MKRSVLFISAFSLFLAATPILAHHSFMTEFDMSKAVIIKGTVAKVTWTNPHISFYIDVTDENGRVTTWGVDGAAPSALVRQGWSRASLKSGDVITVEGFPAKNGRPFAAASMVTLPDGRRLYAGSDGAYPR